MKLRLTLSLMFIVQVIFSTDITGDWLFIAPRDDSFYERFTVTLSGEEDYRDGITQVQIREQNDKTLSVKIFEEDDLLEEFSIDQPSSTSIEYRNGDQYISFKYDQDTDSMIWVEGSNVAGVSWGVGYLRRLGVNYKNGNGTIISQRTEGDLRLTLRTHEQRVQLGDLSDKESRIVYDGHDQTTHTVIHNLSLGDYINITQYYSVESLSSESAVIWLKISTDDNVEGWINMSYKHASSAPYGDNRWSVIEVIETDSKKWTVRKLSQYMAFWVKMNVRDIPGLDGSKVIFQLIPEDSNGSQMNVEIIAMTEEKDSIAGENDHWAKIIDEQGRIGWIYNGYGTIERGGPRYFLPENELYFALGYN